VERVLALSIRGKLVVYRDKTHRSVKGSIRGTTDAYRNDRGPTGDEGLCSGGVDAVDDAGHGPSAAVVYDFDAIEVGFLCNTEDIATDCASDMSAIWKGRRRELVIAGHLLEKRKRLLDINLCGLVGSGQHASFAFPGFHNASRGHTIWGDGYSRPSMSAQGRSLGKQLARPVKSRWVTLQPVSRMNTSVPPPAVSSNVYWNLRRLGFLLASGVGPFTRRARPQGAFDCRTRAVVCISISVIRVVTRSGIHSLTNEYEYECKRRTFFDPGDFGLLPEDVESIG